MGDECPGVWPIMCKTQRLRRQQACCDWLEHELAEPMGSNQLHGINPALLEGKHWEIQSNKKSN